MTDFKARVRSLWRLALQLRRLTEHEDFLPPVGADLRGLSSDLDALCDSIERIIWKLTKEINRHA